MDGSKVEPATAGSMSEDELHRKFGALVQKLREIDEELEFGSMNDITTGAAAERQAMFDALWDVLRFLRWESKVLIRLWHDLQQLQIGIASGALTAVKPRAGRKQDSHQISMLKGRIAGIARLLIESDQLESGDLEKGQSRNRAAAWVARKIPARLASGLSSKPIEASTVKEWMDQYDCGAKILDVFASEEKQKDFESCFAAATTVDEDEQEASIERSVRLCTFLREHVPEHKKHKGRNSISGMMGFMTEIYIGSLFGYRPNFDHLFADLEELATGLMPADSAAADL